jgi:HEAT repeat protein
MKKIRFFAASFLLGVPAAWSAGLPKPTQVAVIKALQDSSLEVRIAAAQALGEAPDENAAKALETALMASADSAEQDAMVRALIASGDKATVKRLMDALANPQFTWANGAKAKAVPVIAKLGDRKPTIRWLTDVAGSEQEPAVRAAALRALGEIGAPPKKEEKK